VSFNGTGNGTWPGGASTVTRTGGSTTATVTTTTAHGLLTGSFIYALTGVAVGSYSVTFISATSFSFTTVATTALTAASITFAVNTINASYNVSSVSDQSTGNYIINFATAIADAYGVCVASAISGGTYGQTTSSLNSKVAQVFTFANAGVAASTAFDHTTVNVAIFR
jgi:Rieske Fe-S protein